jgi:hypothetical protein
MRANSFKIINDKRNEKLNQKADIDNYKLAQLETVHKMVTRVLREARSHIFCFDLFSPIQDNRQLLDNPFWLGWVLNDNFFVPSRYLHIKPIFNIENVLIAFVVDIGKYKCPSKLDELSLKDTISKLYLLEINDNEQ